MRPFFKRLTIAPVAAALTISLALSGAAFADVGDSDWFQPAVTYVVNHGLFGGVSDDRFAPDERMSRGMFYTVLARMDGNPINDNQATNLTDVPQGQWYTGSVIWALSSGIASCQSGSTFGVDSPISRAEICLALSRYDRLSGARRLNSNAAATFVDVGRLAGEERLAVASCQAGGIVQGRTDGRFDPYAGASRAEVAQMISNYCRLQPSQSMVPEVIPDVLAAPMVDALGWTRVYHQDFPLAGLSKITESAVRELNARILYENLPANIAPLGSSIDGDEKHLTNYGAGGIQDCWNVRTNRFNKNNQVDAGVLLLGDQEYYGYSLQTGGLVRQDGWHKTADESGKDPWQCTWWVWGRAAQYVQEALGKDFKTLCGGEDNFGHGKSYYDGLSDYFISDRNPTPNSVISWSCGSYGHVAYVEAVDAGGIWVSMADSGHTWRGITYIRRVNSDSNPYPLHWYGWESLNGFNHLDQPIPREPAATAND